MPAYRLTDITNPALRKQIEAQLAKDDAKRAYPAMVPCPAPCPDTPPPPPTRSRAILVPLRAKGMRYNPAVVMAWFSEMRIAKPEIEYCWCFGRKFRADFAWPENKLMLEVEGGIWNAGKHGRGSGVKKDMEKATVAARNGWRMIRVTPDELCMAETAEAIRDALKWKVYRDANR